MEQQAAVAAGPHEPRQQTRHADFAKHDAGAEHRAVHAGLGDARALRGIPPIYLPAPSSIADYLWRMIADGTMAYHLGVTLLRIFAGFLLAAVTGVVLGVLMGMSRVVARVADPWIAALYPLPKISLIPLLIIWLGTGEAYKIVISAITAFFPIVISTYAGIRQVDRGLMKAAQDLGASHGRFRSRWSFPLRSQHIRRTPARHGRDHHPGGRRRDDRRLEPERHGLSADQRRAGHGNREGICEPGRACGDGRGYHQAPAMDRPQGRAVDGARRDR